MNPKSEKKLLREFLKIIDAPQRAEKKFLNWSKVAMLISVLLLFLLGSDHVNATEAEVPFAACAFAAGVAFGVAIWFLQAGTQTTVMASHISAESIARRIHELDA